MRPGRGPPPEMTILAIYGIAALTHLALETLLGHVNHFRQKAKRTLRSPFDRSVTVVVPVFNEPGDSLRACLDSVAAQDHPSVRVIVVDDGSANQCEHADLYEEFAALPGWTVIQLAENVGKRNAHNVAFERATGDFVVTIDSDTELVGRSALRGILRRFDDPRVGAVTGYVAVRNADQNLLTRLIGLRYWMAFHQERAAQSLFGVMMCCSGPFSAFRRAVIEKVRDDYVSQRFLGRRCSYGDDRHLTNLVLREGWRAVFDEHSRCLTQAPGTLQGYVRQQIRWNKSFYREALWSLRHLAFRRTPYLMLELSFQLVLPFCLLGAIGDICATVASGDRSRLLGYLVSLVALGLLRATYGLVRTRDRNFITFVLYGFLHVLVLIPVRLYALATIRNEAWGTRTLKGGSRRIPAWAADVYAFVPGLALVALTSLVISALAAGSA